ncbi:MotA/TolQ/ExbB proton channel family protein [Alphaproteobacteria bacterium]|nr:MotA/TolQ/ExbB proton channel family protein [Alphaproteobacteria bacterium]
MNETIQKILENSATYQAPAFEFTELVTALFIAPIKDPISGVFIGLILYVFLGALWPRLPFANILSKNAVATLPSIGILGTFIGVLVAVSQFDTSPDGMVQSLGVIMQGLKIAFSTSIYGLAGSIVVRLNAKASSDSNVEVGPDEILDAIRKGNSESKSGNAKLVDAIAGDADGSLNNQLRLMRQDLTDFAKTVAEANTTAFIDALKEAIADFNQNLTEQFGENFAKLNEAVGKLLEWQENNKKDMEALRDTLDQFVQAAKDSSTAIQEIEKATATIPETVTGLANLLEKLDAQIEDIEQRLSAFAEISEKASSALPEIREILVEYTDGLRQSMDGVLTQVREITESQEVGFNNLTASYESIAAKIEESGQNIENTFSRIANELDDTTSKTSQLVIDTSAQIIEQNRAAADEHEQIIKKAAFELSENIQTAVGNAVGEIANASNTSSAELTRVMKEASDNASQILQSHSTSIEDLKAQLSLAVNNFANEFNSQLETSMKSQDTALADFSDRLKNAYESSNSKLEKLVSDYFAEMQQRVDQTLDREMQELASRLGAISKRIADDYGPLTDQFRKIVELGDQATSGSRKK